VRAKPKSNSVVTHELVTVDSVVMGIVFKVKTGETLEGEVAKPVFETTTLEFDKLAKVNRERAEIHGWIQRVSDRAAIARNTETGKSATPVEKFNAMKTLVEFYNSGSENWAMAGSGPGPSAEFNLLVTALCEAYANKSREDLTKWAKARSAGERTALMESVMLKGIVERLRSENAKGVNVDELLKGLDDDETGGGVS
jgi:hypothetical protein